ncbi:MAG: sensor histidine kinase [Clostridia bacterium]|nr:sensor histidine kinase [Clostridia bacterium]
MAKRELIKIEPYARLLTMLSEQLIKNEVVALTEIVKNAYDADSNWVRISFENFTRNYKAQKDSRIIIEDCGCGMTEEVLRHDFINPASANKKIKKERGETSPNGRILQGEKGIGRFSLFKLGKTVTVYTKTKDDTSPRKLIADFSKYGDEFLNDDESQIMLSELDVEFISEATEFSFEPQVMLADGYAKRPNQGTTIIVENLNDSWGKAKIEKLQDELMSLIGNDEDDFSIYIFKDNSFLPSVVITEDDRLQKIIDQKAVYKIEGHYIEKESAFEFTINGKAYKKDIYDKQINKLSTYKKYKVDKGFKENDSLENNSALTNTECGDFSFRFYVFDLEKQYVREKFRLPVDDLKIVKKNRVYLYRDGIRVFPYGSIKDDWLQVDTIRGTQKASAMFSNDQLIGYVNITYKDNPNLKDKTNREGLMEVGNAYLDFVAMIQCFLQYIKVYHYDLDYANKKNAIKKFDKNEQINLSNSFSKVIKEVNDDSIKKQLIKIQQDVEKQSEYQLGRIRVVEDLAGIGLSIQATHHDLNNFIKRSYNVIDDYSRNLLIDDNSFTDKSIVLEKLERLRGLLSAMDDLLVDMKSLFASTQRKSKQIRVAEVLNKVIGYYKNLFVTKNINFDVKSIGNNPLVITMPEALLMTIFINIFDNAIYWLEDEDKQAKQIRITINCDEQCIIFSDNGPGIYPEEEEKIFEAFFTGKGLEGRGLGLYICRQFMERYDYHIQVIKNTIDCLNGANFLLDFNKE